MLKDERPPYYTFETFMHIDIEKKCGITFIEIQELVGGVCKLFVDK